MVADTCLWTVNDLDAIPDDGGWTRSEIVAGELLATRSPHAYHQSDRALQLVSTLKAEDTLSSPLLPGFSASAALIVQ